jgi:DNA polymerase-2
VYGRLEDGASFLVRDDRQRPHFYIRAADLDRARAIGAPAALPTTKRTFDGVPCADWRSTSRETCRQCAIGCMRRALIRSRRTVRFAMRYLIERGIKAGCAIQGEASAGKGVTWVFDNPTLRPADVRIDPRMLSFDIETGRQGTVARHLDLRLGR